MNGQRVSEFFEKMSRSPDLLKEFVALAARHGIDVVDGQLSEAELANVSGGGDLLALVTQEQGQATQESFEAMSKAMKALHATQQDVISNLKG